MAGVRLPRCLGAALGGFSPQFSCGLVDFDAQYGGTSYDTSMLGSVVTGGGSSWQSGAYASSSSMLAVGDYIEFVLSDCRFIGGVTYSVAPSVGWNETDFGFYLASPSVVYFVEGSLISSPLTCSIGDVFRIEVTASGAVDYFQNGDLVRTNAGTVSGSLFPHFASGDAGVVSSWQMCNVATPLLAYGRSKRAWDDPDWFILERGYYSVAGELVVPSVEELEVLHGYDIAWPGNSVGDNIVLEGD